MINAKIVCDSVAPNGRRLTTFELHYPRLILAEVNTHRALSRNSASSRAIPVKKTIGAVWSDPAMPVYWGGAAKGMQAGGELKGWRLKACKFLWRLSARTDCIYAYLMMKLGLHKQVANRVAEPAMWMTTLVTATEWGNFFNLRAHPDAQPEFQELAFRMLQAYINSEPRNLRAGEWHLPYGDKYQENLTEDELIKACVARCARVSYVNHDGDADLVKDIEMYERLLGPGHLSPFEHVARALDIGEGNRGSGNFRGFEQYRKTIANENREAFDATKLYLKMLESRCA